MKSRWNDAEAAKYVAEYGAAWGEDLALRTYTSRLIGQEQDVVLHGGGNTSVKGQWRNAWGEPMAAVYVKGSGWDLAKIRPEYLRIKARYAKDPAKLTAEMRALQHRQGPPPRA